MTVHAFIDESARPPQYLIAAAIVEPAQVRLLRQSMRALLMPGQRELHFKKEKPTRRRALADAIARLPVEVCVTRVRVGGSTNLLVRPALLSS